jgi:mannosyltransferase OCH1-like enzyme
MELNTKKEYMNIKLLHFIWLGKNIPSYPTQWLTMNPDWELIIWNEDNMIKLQNQALYDASFKYPNMQSDIARVEILYKYGGVYIDCDVVPLKPLGNFFEKQQDLVVFYENETKIPGVIANTVMATQKNHSIWLSIIKYYSKKQPPRINTFIANYTGPYKITPFFVEYKAQVLPSYYFYPEWYNTKIRDPKPEDYPNSYGFHLWAQPNKLFNWNLL